MEISVENAGPYNSVRLYGQLDSCGAGAIYEAIVELGSKGPGRVVVSVAEVTFATRAGCGALFVAAKLLHTRTGERMQITDASPEIASILNGAGFDHLVEVQLRPEAGVAFVA
ncbi:MAG: STAS domain-containing protein [Pseudomonadota bacterium]